MALYESAEHPFSIQYPAEWIEHPEVQNGGVVVWRTGSEEEWFVIVEGGFAPKVHVESKVLGLNQKSVVHRGLKGNEAKSLVTVLPRSLIIDWIRLQYLQILLVGRDPIL